MSMSPIQLQLGLQVIQSYKRLSYTPWHAIAELVDNSTQSYFDNRDELDKALTNSQDRLTVGIAYNSANGGFLRVSDNAMGMSYDELVNALRVGFPPKNTSGRSKYGMGMKTASCWIGNKWTVRTKKLGEEEEHFVSVDVDKIANGDDLPPTFVPPVMLVRQARGQGRQARGPRAPAAGSPESCGV